MSESTPKSFIENVNTVANATALATGDIIEDTKIARDEAQAAATAARKSELLAEDSEAKAEEWAQKGYNSEVETDRYSAFHWSETARLTIGDPIINDIVISKLYTWSSDKIVNSLSEKANEVHTHSEYELSFTKNGAFNLPFGGTGTANLVARSDHTHTGYELEIGTKNTAFNKNFGTQSGTVSEGDHNHDTSYMKITDYTTSGLISSSKLPWVADLANPGAGEIPRGTHTHAADTLPYDPSNDDVVTSSTVQGAISQLDDKFNILDIAEKTHLTAGISQVHEIPITGIDTAVRINAPVALLYSSHATLSGGSDINVAYTVAPDKKIEGTVSVAITLSSAMVEDIALSIAVDDVILGEHSSGTSRTLTLSKHLIALPEDGFSISFWITNRTNTNNIFIDSMDIVWVGAPEGAIVASGISVDHSDLTGTGAVGGVHTISDIQSLTTTLDTKADKEVPATPNNFAMLDASGNLADSGVLSTDVGNAMLKINPATLDNIVVQTSLGDAKDGGVSISDLALVGGAAAQTFEVANGTGTQAINKNQLDSFATTVPLTTDLTTHTADTNNPHTVTLTQVGGAAAVHTHAIGDVTNLEDTLNLKYTKVAAPVTDNLVIFETGGLLKDSLVSVSDIGVNTGNIVTNTTDISTNTTNISTNTTEITKKLTTDAAGITGASALANAVTLDQAAYDALTRDPDTLYFIPEV